MVVSLIGDVIKKLMQKLISRKRLLNICARYWCTSNSTVHFYIKIFFMSNPSSNLESIGMKIPKYVQSQNRPWDHIERDFDLHPRNSRSSFPTTVTFQHVKSLFSICFPITDVAIMTRQALSMFLLERAVVMQIAGRSLGSITGSNSTYRRKQVI